MNHLTLANMCMILGLVVGCSSGITVKTHRTPKQSGTGAPIAQPSPKDTQKPAQPTPTSPAPGNGTADAGGIKPATELQPLALNGHWRSDCEVDDKEGTSEADVDTYDGDTLEQIQMNYGDTNCSSLQHYLIINAKFQVGGLNANVAGAREIDYTIQKVSWVAKNEEAAASIESFLSKNDSPDCKNLKIEVDIATDVTACNLLPKMFFDLIKIDGIKLIQGDCDTDDMCSSKEKRATKLEDTYSTHY